MPIKIALIGMDERSVMRLSTIFKMIYKGRCATAQVADADLAIVDLEGETDAWSEFRQQFPDLPAIVMSASPTSIAGAIFVAKPAKLDLLWESIYQLATGLLSPDALARQADAAPDPAVAVAALVEKAPPPQPTPETHHTSAAADAIKLGEDTTRKIVPREDASVFYNPDDYLLGRILSAVNDSTGQQCSIHVQCWKDRQLILLPDQGQAFTDLTDHQRMNLGIASAIREHAVEINSICGSGSDETSGLWMRAFSRLLGKGELPAVETDGLHAMPLDYLLWDLALRTARGRVPEGTDLDKPVYLRCWPNFTRLPMTAHSMRIAALWVTGPSTLADIAGNLGIELAEVYSFYSAAVATGLAGPANRQADGLVALRPGNEGGLRRGLRNAILRHFDNHKQRIA